MVYLNLFHPLGIDFPQFYEATKMIFTDLNPYLYLLTSPGPWNYPPSAFLFLWWLNLFPYGVAAAIWNISSLLSFTISLWLLLKIAFSRRMSLGYWFIGLLTLFSLTFFPLKHNLASGQINNFILLFLTLSIYFAKPFFLAYAAAIKIIPALFLLYFLLRRQHKFILGFLASLIILLLLSFLLIPWGSQQIYFADVAPQAWSLSGKEIYYNQSLLGLLSRTFTSQTVVLYLSYLLNSLFIVLTWWQSRGLSKNRQIAAVSSLLLILPPLVWQHHYVLAIIPLILLFPGNKLLVAISYLLLAANIKQPELVPLDLNIILSHQFLGVFLLWLTALWQEKSWVIIIALIYVLNLTCRGLSC